VLVCVGKGRRANEAMRRAPGFIISILGREHEQLARQFASPVEDRFAGVRVDVCADGTPAIADALATFACRRSAIVDGGDHSIFVGHVTNYAARDGDPLVHCGGRFAKVLPVDADTDATRPLAHDWLDGAPW
jgi:flavin reductase (DIM6/NTAB) family NADH-FMN oxidoreductase RutF